MVDSRRINAALLFGLTRLVLPGLRMASVGCWLSILLLGGCAAGKSASHPPVSFSPAAMERIIVAPDGHGFVKAATRQAFNPWGMNYGNSGRLMEDFWETDWKTFEDDFYELKALGANVVRVHLQVGKFMDAPGQPNAASLRQFERMLRLAEKAGIYLDVTGLACYRPSDTPLWYDVMDETARWTAQANFWEAVAKIGAGSPAVFCFDLINEPISPAQKREPGKWPSGSSFGGMDFLQYIALDPAGRTRDEIAAQWIRRMTAAIRSQDREALITVGMLPWSRQWKHLSGFLPKTVAPELDFFSVHIYPDSKKPGEAVEALRQVAVGKPVVIEETFPLSCSTPELEKFLLASRKFACGWIGHYDGANIEELDASERAGRLTIAQSIYRDWQRLFVRLHPEMIP